MDWIYDKTEDNSSRFSLGTVGENPLVCFGINPSTAEPNKLDPTVNTVSRIASLNGYDSFLMFNVYPQRATNPNDLHEVYSLELKNQNEKTISSLIARRKLTVWAAWGNLITKRKYLMELVHGIVSLPELRQCSWVSRGRITKNGHPHHPLYVKQNAPFDVFDIKRYQL